RNIPVAPGPVNDPGTPKLGHSGADDAMSIFDNAVIRWAGGAVPQTIGYRFDAITLFNSRPAIVNTDISLTGTGTDANTGTAQAAISGDMDSFREDDTARGPLVRNTSVHNNSLNGILVRSEFTGVVQPTDAISYQPNPTTGANAQGGVQ